MDSTAKTERWTALADAIASHTVEDYENSMFKLEEGVENLPIPFRDRAQLWSWLVERGAAAQTDEEGVLLMTEEVKTFVGIHRRSAEAREQDVFAPELDLVAFAYRIKKAAK